jgi:hypothetical protein
MAASTKKETKSKVFDPRAWGLSREEIEKLGQRLYEFWERYAECFETTTRDTSHYALSFLSGLLRMTIERNFSNIARVTGESSQNVQHFMTNSPWSGQEVFSQIREEVAQQPTFAEGGALILDESADMPMTASGCGLMANCFCPNTGSHVGWPKSASACAFHLIASLPPRLNWGGK